MSDINPFQPPPERKGPGKGKRSYKRRPQDRLESNFGPVLDLSAGGMRIIAKRDLAGIVEVTLDGQGIHQTVRARVVWTKKVGFRMYEVAMTFIDAREIQHLVEWISLWSRPNSAA